MEQGRKETVERQCLLGEVLKRFLYTGSNGVESRSQGLELKRVSVDIILVTIRKKARSLA